MSATIKLDLAEIKLAFNILFLIFPSLHHIILKIFISVRILPTAQCPGRQNDNRIIEKVGLRGLQERKDKVKPKSKSTFNDQFSIPGLPEQAFSSCYVRQVARNSHNEVLDILPILISFSAPSSFPPKKYRSVINPPAGELKLDIST